MCLIRVGETGQRHFFTGCQRVEESLELCLIRMIADVAAIEHLHRELRPRVLVEAAKLLAVEFVIENGALAADQVRVEVVRLEAINDCRALAD